MPPPPPTGKFYWKIRTFRQRLKKLLNNCMQNMMTSYPRTVETLGKTMLVEMEIDTGNHPSIASKPYTLRLKHYEWVEREIETLE